MIVGAVFPQTETHMVSPFMILPIHRYKKDAYFLVEKAKIATKELIAMAKKKIDYHEHDEVFDFPNISNVASANETTGMMPTPPETTDEYQSYQEVASMAIPKKAPGRRVHPEQIRTQDQDRNHDIKI